MVEPTDEDTFRDEWKYDVVLADNLQHPAVVITDLADDDEEV